MAKKKIKIKVVGKNARITSRSSPLVTKESESNITKTTNTTLKTVSIVVGIAVSLISIYQFFRREAPTPLINPVSAIIDTLPQKSTIVETKTDTIIKYKPIIKEVSKLKTYPIVAENNGVVGVAQEGGTVIQNTYMADGRPMRHVSAEEIELIKSIPRDYKVIIKYISNHVETNGYAQELIAALRAQNLDVQAEGMLMLIGDFDQRYKLHINKDDDKKIFSITVLEQING